MTGSQLSRIGAVVGKLLSLELPVYIPNEPVRRDLRGIKLDLDLYVLRDGLEGRP